MIKRHDDYGKRITDTRSGYRNPSFYKLITQDVYPILSEMESKNLEYAKVEEEFDGKKVVRESTLKDGDIFIKRRYIDHASIIKRGKVVGEEERPINIYEAKFKNGNYLKSKIRLIDGVPYFYGTIFINKVKEYIKKYTNDEIVDMQQNFQDHEVIKALKVISETFSDDENTISVSDEEKEQ